MSAALYCTNRFAPCETESPKTPNVQQLNPPDSTPLVTDEEFRKMHLDELVCLWLEGRL
jgi:hypothetical protein